MDVPTRIIEEERLWRFKAMVLPRAYQSVKYQFQNPIPITSAGRLVGCAVLYIDSGNIMGDCVVDYSIPERLDCEAGIPTYALPRCTIQSTSFKGWNGSPPSGSVIIITALELRHDCTESAHEPIGATL